ncbi:MAG: hypothetical protein ACKVQV_04835 [Bacteroidia bacterium]
MKHNIDFKILGQIMLSIILGGLFGLAIELWRGTHNAVLICAIGAGIAALWRHRNNEKVSTN